MLQEEVLEKSKRILGDDHPDTLTTMNNLAVTYRAQGKTAEAAVLQEEVLEKRKRILGDDHPDTLTTMNNLAETYRAQGKTAEAAVLHEEVLEKSKRILGDDHPDTLTTMNNLACDVPGTGEDGGGRRVARESAGEEQADPPACWLPMWIQFFLPSATGRMEFSARLLLSSSSGYCRKRVSFGQSASV